MSLGRVEVSPGALLLAALLYYLDDSGVYLWGVLAAVLHEAGHWWAVTALGGRVRRLKVTCAGAELRLSAARPLGPGRTALAALAGPGMNLLLAFASAALTRWAGGRLYLFAGINLGLALFNLLPAGWLDGGRMVESVAALLDREALGRQVTAICSWVTAALLLGLGAALLWGSGGRSFTLLIAGLWTARAARRTEDAVFA